MNSLNTLSLTQLKQAVSLKEQIASLESELAAILGTATPSAPVQRKGTMSAAGKARIVAAQKARWARIKGQAAEAMKPVKKKFTMSAAAREAISKAAKARWAKIKQAQKK